MKNLLVLLTAITFHAGVMAQQLTLRFEGSNANNENEKMFTVDIDGTPYHSQDAEELSNGRARQMEIPNLTLGSHTIKVYRDDNNAAANDEDSETAVYSNTFQLRTAPAFAPSRSTRCNRRNPASSNCRATSSGCSL